MKRDIKPWPPLGGSSLSMIPLYTASQIPPNMPPQMPPQMTSPILMSMELPFMDPPPMTPPFIPQSMPSLPTPGQLSMAPLSMPPLPSMLPLPPIPPPSTALVSTPPMPSMPQSSMALQSMALQSMPSMPQSMALQSMPPPPMVPPGHEMYALQQQPARPTKVVTKRKPNPRGPGCQLCQSIHIDCDFLRPTCGPCRAKRRLCRYDYPDPAQEAAARKRQPLAIGPEITKRAFEAFHSTIGELLYVYTPEQTEEALQASQVFNVGDLSGRPRQQSAKCCVMAVAAVGEQYVIHQSGPASCEDMYYNMAERYYDVLVEHQPLESVKVAILLAMYNMLLKPTAAWAYTEMGLTMGRGLGLESDVVQVQDVTQDEWDDYRKAWTTLNFISTWLSATHGYTHVPGFPDADALVPKMESVGPQASKAKVAQSQLSKITEIKKRILSIAPQCSLSMRDVATAVSNDVNGIIEQLPRHAQPASLTSTAKPLGPRLTLFQVRLLSEGTALHLYRACAAQLAHCASVDQPHGIVEMDASSMIDRLKLAWPYAYSSAKMMKMLLNEGSLPKRCAFMTFNAYNCCMFLLHVTVQQRLHGVPVPNWEKHLEYANYCMAVLESCAPVNKVAAGLHSEVQGIYDAAQMVYPPRFVNPSGCYLLEVPRACDEEQRELSRKVRTLLWGMCGGNCRKEGKRPTPAPQNLQQPSYIPVQIQPHQNFFQQQIPQLLDYMEPQQELDFNLLVDYMEPNQDQPKHELDLNLLVGYTEPKQDEPKQEFDFNLLADYMEPKQDEPKHELDLNLLAGYTEQTQAEPKQDELKQEFDFNLLLGPSQTMVIYDSTPVKMEKREEEEEEEQTKVKLEPFTPSAE